MRVTFILHFAFASTAILPTLTSAAELSHDPDEEQAVVPTDGVIRLFDGRTLGDCYTWLKDSEREDPRKVFRVTDGMLHVTGDGLGGIITNKRYRRYHLVLEFKWGTRTWRERENAARDSGLLIHSNGIDGGYNGTWMPAIEVQIIEGGVGDIVPVPGSDHKGQPVPIAYTCNVRHEGDQVIWDPKGGVGYFRRRPQLKRVNWWGRDPAWQDKLDFRGPRDLDSPVGQWTRLDVYCDSYLVIFVNGTKANVAFDLSPREGRIQLQSELAEIYFRRWELWPLDKGPAPTSAEQQ